MMPASLPPMLPSRQDRRSRHRIGREPAEDRRDSPRAILPPKPPFRLPKTAAPLLDGEEAGKAVPYHPAVAFRECTGPANDQGLVEREELETDLARDVEPGLAPVPEHHVARPPARGRGDHGQDRLIVGLLEVYRRDGHGRPALRGQGRWQGRGTTISSRSEITRRFHAFGGNPVAQHHREMAQMVVPARYRPAQHKMTALDLEGEHVLLRRGGLKGHEVARLPAELDADEVDRPARGAVLVRVAPLA